MLRAIDIDKPQEQQSRVELTLARIATAWRSQYRGSVFARGLLDFFNSFANRNTLRSYSFAILEFFDWYHKTKGLLPTPDRVRRAEASDYLAWLVERERGLDGWRIESDPARRLDAAIFNIVRTNPGCGIDLIANKLAMVPEFVTFANVETEGRVVARQVLRIEVDRHRTGGLSRHLACLVEHRSLTRTPSLADIRGRRVDFGLINPERAGIDYEVDPRVFRYQVPVQSADGISERGATIASRLRALSSLWSFYASSGENQGQAEPLLRYNIWTEPLRQVLPKAEASMAVARAQRTPQLSLVDRLVATTYERTYGAMALQAAQADIRGQPVTEPVRRVSFKDLRDRALMITMLQTGLRADEIAKLRRGDVQGDPPVVTVTGKGHRKRLIRLPPTAHRVISQLTRKIQLLAKHQLTYRPNVDSRAAALLSAGAPLFPAVVYWGANANVDRINKPLTRQAIDIMLRRRALRAGFDRGTMQYLQAHPHGFRHLFAKLAEASGTSLPKIQAIMGHADISVTGRYVEAREPEELVAEAFKPPAPAPVPEPPSPPVAPTLPPLVRRAPVVKIRREKPVPKSRPEPPIGPPAELPAEPLVGFGEPPAATELTLKISPERTTAEKRAVGRLDQIYEMDWGEKGHTQRLVDLAIASGTAALATREPLIAGQLKLRGLAALEESAETEGLAIDELVEDFELVPIGDVKKLTQTFIGRRSGLLWWNGTGGDLKPQMPVMSAGQVGSCSVADQGDICVLLGELWRSWWFSEQQHRGPTAAAALVAWVVEALDEAAQVERERELREAQWVPFDAPLSETQAKKGQAGHQRTVWREHDKNAVVQWFNDVAWRYEVSFGGGKEGRTAKVKDLPYEAPSWYAVVDPIASLPSDERAEALDWIAALTGQPFVDNVPRFAGTSRVELGRLLSLLCLYDERADELTEQRRSGVDRPAVAVLGQAVAEAAEQVRSLVSALTRGRVADFDISAYRKQRAAVRRAALPGARVGRAESHLDILGMVFGEQAAKDVALRVMAGCGPAPLSTTISVAAGSGADLFRLSGGTIRHEQPYLKRFADATGAHSECVARRIARDLWELKKQALAGRPQRVIERSDELVRFVASLAAYRVPCPSAMESQLRFVLGKPSEPQPIYEAWARIRRERPEEPLFPAESEEEFEDLQREFETQIGAAELGGGGFYLKNRRGRPYFYNAASAPFLPNPIWLLFAAFAW